MTLHTAMYFSPIGGLVLAEKDGSLFGVWMEKQKYFPCFLGELIQPSDTAVLRQTKDWLDRYFRGERPTPGELPLAPEGSEFRRTVWRLLCEIPYGQTTTYGAIARTVAACRSGAMSAQAVGDAVAHNPIAIVIPCHRVIGADGRLTGYAGGLEKKVTLLALEGIDVKALCAATCGKSV